MIGPNATTTTTSTSTDGALHYPAGGKCQLFPFLTFALFERKKHLRFVNYSGLEEISDYDGNQLQGWQGRLLRFHIYTYTRVAYLEGESQ